MLQLPSTMSTIAQIGNVNSKLTATRQESFASRLHISQEDPVHVSVWTKLSRSGHVPPFFSSAVIVRVLVRVPWALELQAAEHGPQSLQGEIAQFATGNR